jgi:hypothetical protein
LQAAPFRARQLTFLQAFKWDNQDWDEYWGAGVNVTLKQVVSQDDLHLADVSFYHIALDYEGETLE